MIRKRKMYKIIICAIIIGILLLTFSFRTEYSNFRLMENNKFEAGELKIDSNDEYNYAYMSNFGTISNNNTPDPFMYREDGIYYLFGTFASKTIYMYTSSDLSNWSTKIKAMDEIEDNNINWIWAPEVYKYDNKYYILFSGVKIENGEEKEASLYIAKTDSLKYEGNELNKKFSNVKRINLDNQGNVIDGNILFENNNIYLYYKCESDGSICVSRLSENFEVIESKKILSKSNNTWEKYYLEGPFTFKYNEKYYLMYSSGGYYNNTYAIGYAIAETPEGPFKKITTEKPLISGEEVKDNIYDTDNGIYGTGHNMVLKTGNDEYYCVYHRAVLDKNGKFKYRTLMIDKLNIEKDEKLKLDGPKKEIQPLPSGTKNSYGVFYQIKSNQYNLKSSNTKNVEILSDGNTYYANNECAIIKDVEITLNERRDISDIWIYLNKERKENNEIRIKLNNEQEYKINVGNNMEYKIQLPKLKYGIKKINVSYEKEEEISEIILVANGEATYDDSIEKCANDILKNNRTIVDNNINMLQNEKIGQYYNNLVEKLNRIQEDSYNIKDLESVLDDQYTFINTIVDQYNEKNLAMTKSAYKECLQQLFNITYKYITFIEYNFNTDNIKKAEVTNSLNNLIKRYNDNSDIDISTTTDFIIKLKEDYNQITDEKSANNLLLKKNIINISKIVLKILENDIKENADSEYNAITISSDKGINYFTNQDETITINLPKNAQITSESSNGFKFSANGTKDVKLSIRGYEYTYTIKVNNIDKIVPKVMAQNGQSLKINATDDNLKEIKIEKDGKETAVNNGQTITTPGIYKIIATDKAGNSANENAIVYGTYTNEQNSQVNYVTIKSKTKVRDIKQDGNYTIKDNNNITAEVKRAPSRVNTNTEKDSNSYIATGDILQDNNNAYIVITLGDLSSNGDVGAADLIKLRKSLVGLTKLTKIQELAADTNQNGSVNVSDLLKERKIMVGAE